MHYESHRYSATDLIYQEWMISDIWLFLRKEGLSCGYNCLQQHLLAQKRQCRLCLSLENPAHRTGGLNVGPAITHRETKLSYWYLPCQRPCCFPWPFRRVPCNDILFCLYFFTEIDDGGDYVDVLPWRICTWRFGKLSFQDVPWCSASAGESFQLGILCSRSGITLLLLQTVRVAVSSTKQAIMPVCSAIKVLFVRHKHTHTHRYGGRCPWMCLLVVFSQQIVQDVDC